MERGGSKRALAAEALKPTSYELLKLKVIDDVIKEPLGVPIEIGRDIFERER